MALKDVNECPNAIITGCSAQECGSVELKIICKTEQEMVKEFHVRNGFIVEDSIHDEPHSRNSATIDLDYLISKLAVQLETLKVTALRHQELGDERLYRAWLMLEELTEVLEGMSSNSEQTLADGLGDLLYVTYGTAVTYNIPMKEVFVEIQKANMAKKKRDPLTNPRMRDKGEGWLRPDIVGAIMKGRKENKHWKDMTINELETECKIFQDKINNSGDIVEELVNEIKTRKIANRMNPGTYK